MSTLRYRWSISPWRTIKDVATHQLTFCAYMLAIAVFFFWAAMAGRSERRAAFMDECLEDNKQYVCTSMYRDH